MHTTEHTDVDGDALTIHRDKGLAWITLTRGGEELTVGPVPAHVLWARGGDVRHEKHDAPGPLEQAADRIIAVMRPDQVPVRECPDPEQHDEANAALAQMAKDFRVVQAQRDYAGKRARKAEQERDEARAASNRMTVTLTRLLRALDLPEDADADAMVRAAESRPVEVTDEMVRRAKAELEARAGGDYYPETLEAVLTAALTEPPQRPAWLDAPAVRAWHENDQRTEHDGTPGKPRIWSPDYGTTETWSTPSLPGVHWSELVDVEPLIVNGEQS